MLGLLPLKKRSSSNSSEEDSTPDQLEPVQYVAGVDVLEKGFEGGAGTISRAAVAVLGFPLFATTKVCNRAAIFSMCRDFYRFAKYQPC